MLLRVSHKTPIGQLHIIADEHVVLASGFGDVENLIDRLDEIDRAREIFKVSNIAKISDLVLDYFDGELNALDSISVRQPGASFHKLHGKLCEKLKLEKLFHMPT